MEVAGSIFISDGTKRSARGLLRVNADLSLSEDVTEDQEGGELRTVFHDGKAQNVETLAEIRRRIGKSLHL